MRVLELNDRFPDRRVEKTIHSDQRLGHSVRAVTIYLAPGFSMDQVEFIKFPLSLHHALFRMKKFRMALKQVIEEVDPDVIHAHNVFFARASIEQGYPVVYNDHEYWSFQEKHNHPFSTPWTPRFLKKKLSWFYRYPIIKKWEKEVLQNSVVISVHENIVREHLRVCPAGFVMPNQPEREEVQGVWEQAKKSERDFDAVYVGGDMLTKSYAHRQAHQSYKDLKSRGFRLLIVGDKKAQFGNQILSVGFVPHQEIYKYTIRGKTGLLPWKSHPYFKYVSPNKLYFYFHSGAIPIVPKEVSVPYENEKVLAKFSSLRELPQVLHRIVSSKIDHEGIVNHAKEHYLWEYHESALKNAYEKALEVSGKLPR